MKIKIKTKEMPALCETGQELCDLLIHDIYDWHSQLINDCMNPAYRADLKAIYREGLRLYHRHVEQMLDYQAQREILVPWPLDSKHPHTDAV